ncbi:MAG TPA: glutamate formimidoyltransferase [Actinomycetota bacterium]|nr:glutamate formimidoyltransferase [Actinomycetota bacterium]
MSTEPLVVCVPNFSEGRRAEVMDAICDALSSVPGARLVYRQADAEHNRLDTTIAGSPDAVRAAALAGARVAVERIDMREHSGGHPRMGAADVIPFVPLRGISMDECVELARAFAKELAGTLGIPVYLFDRAALAPERANLAEVRKGEFEGLRDAVARGERLPDFGPHEIGRAGATAVGARKALVAFNLYLSGSEADAKEIAKSVRESSGGLPAVRAIGFAVPERGCVTVSMNLVDVEVTGLRAAFDAVRAEGERRGMDVLDSEIVGLVPQAALGPDDVTYLRLEGFDAEHQILERLVSGGGIHGQGVGAFLDALASDAPTPGGGAVAGLAGAMGAALIEMVANLTIGKKGYEGVGERMGALLAEAEAARGGFVELADRDATAFDGVMAAFKMPKGTDAEKAARTEAIQRGYEAAATVPLDTGKRAVALMELAREATEKGNVNAASDGASAAVMLFAAASCAAFNVDINAAGMKDAARAEQLRTEVATMRAEAAALLDATNRAFAQRFA